MLRLPEPDDVDFFVAGTDSNPDTVRETIEAIADFKRRPGYPERKAEAERILAELGIDPRDYGRETAQSLLDQWQRCAESPQSGDHDHDESAGEDHPAPESTGRSGRVLGPK